MHPAACISRTHVRLAKRPSRLQVHVLVQPGGLATLPPSDTALCQTLLASLAALTVSGDWPGVWKGMASRRAGAGAAACDTQRSAMRAEAHSCQGRTVEHRGQLLAPSTTLAMAKLQRSCNAAWVHPAMQQEPESDRNEG
jgi:hypothetical protein